MATKKMKRDSETRARKKKKGTRTLLLSSIIVVIIGLLIFFFVTLFDTLFPTTAGKGSAAKKRDKKEVVLFFSDANERFLVTEKRYITRESSDEEQAKELVKALLDGSKLGNISTFPQQADVQSLKVQENGTVNVSFGRNLLKNHPGGSASEMATIYSLTNTLTTNIQKIKKVKILVEGKEIASIKGHIDTKNPFSFKDMQVPGAQ